MCKNRIKVTGITLFNNSQNGGANVTHLAKDAMNCSCSRAPKLQLRPNMSIFYGFATYYSFQITFRYFKINGHFN